MSKINLQKNKALLCFGTAKVGIKDYGYAKTGLGDNPDDLISTALQHGISWFDTSPRYGNAETILGRHIAERLDIKVSTKVDNLVPGNPDTPEDILKSVRRSLLLLKRQYFDIVYLHQEKLEILTDPYVHEGLLLLKDKGLAKQIGSSTYTEDELGYVISNDCFDWVQVASNILDVSQIHIIKKENEAVNVAARSIFLQGVLLRQKVIDSGIPMASGMKKKIDSAQKIASCLGLSLAQLATSFMVNHSKVNMALFGAGTISNIKAFCENSQISLPEEAVVAIQDIAKHPKYWTNIKRWKLS